MTVNNKSSERASTCERSDLLQNAASSAIGGNHYQFRYGDRVRWVDRITKKIQFGTVVNHNSSDNVVLITPDNLDENFLGSENNYSFNPQESSAAKKFAKENNCETQEGYILIYATSLQPITKNCRYGDRVLFNGKPATVVFDYAEESIHSDCVLLLEDDEKSLYKENYPGTSFTVNCHSQAINRYCSEYNRSKDHTRFSIVPKIFIKTLSYLTDKKNAVVGAVNSTTATVYANSTVKEQIFQPGERVNYERINGTVVAHKKGYNPLIHWETASGNIKFRSASEYYIYSAPALSYLESKKLDSTAKIFSCGVPTNLINHGEIPNISAKSSNITFKPGDRVYFKGILGTVVVHPPGHQNPIVHWEHLPPIDQTNESFSAYDFDLINFDYCVKYAKQHGLSLQDSFFSFSIPADKISFSYVKPPETSKSPSPTMKFNTFVDKNGQFFNVGDEVIISVRDLDIQSLEDYQGLVYQKSENYSDQVKIISMFGFHPLSAQELQDPKIQKFASKLNLPIKKLKSAELLASTLVKSSSTSSETNDQTNNQSTSKTQENKTMVNQFNKGDWVACPTLGIPHGRLISTDKTGRQKLMCFEMLPGKEDFGAKADQFNNRETLEHNIFRKEATEYSLLLDFVHTSNPLRFTWVYDHELEAITPSKIKSNWHKSTSNNISIPVVSDQKSKPSMLRQDVSKAAYRVGVKQLNQAIHTAIIDGLICRGASEEELGIMQNFLKSEYGVALIGILLGIGLPNLPKYGTDDRVQELSKEFRIQAMTSAGNEALNNLFDSVVKMIAENVNSLPDETFHKTTDDQELTEALEEEEDLEMQNAMV